MTHTVTRLEERTVINAQGRPELVVRATFRVGDSGPFSAELPRAGFTAAKLEAEVARLAVEIERVLAGAKR